MTTTIFDNLYDHVISSKSEQEQYSIYNDIIAQDDFNKSFHFFAMCEKSLDDVVKHSLLEKLFKLTNLQLKTNNIARELLPKLLATYMKYSLKLPTLSKIGWNVLGGHTKLCYDYVIMRKYKFHPTIRNLNILNMIRKHNINICENNFKKWIFDKSINKLMVSSSEFPTLITFFSKLSNNSIKLYIQYLKNTKQTKKYKLELINAKLWVVSCNKNLDLEDIKTIFELFDVCEIFKTQMSLLFFEFYNDDLLDYYYNQEKSKGGIRPKTRFLEKFTVDSIKSNLSSNFRKKIIDFALFFHVIPSKTNNTATKIKDSYLPVITNLIKYFTPDNMLTLDNNFINSYTELKELFMLYVDPLILYVKNINNKSHKKSKGNHCSEDEYSYNSEIDYDSENDCSENDDNYDNMSLYSDVENDSEIENNSVCLSEDINYKSKTKFSVYNENTICTLYEILKVSSIEAMIAVNVIEHVNKIYKPDDFEQLSDTLMSFDDEKTNVIIDMIKHSYRNISTTLFLAFDAIYKSKNLILSIYKIVIEQRTKKLRLNLSYEIPSDITKEDIIAIIFDTNDDPVGICNICYEGKLNQVCKSCGNCVCSQCFTKLKLKKCPYCNNKNNFMTVRI